MILVLDNYDSFTHNLARYIRLAGQETLVVRSDAIDAAGVAELRPEGLVLSPGPGRPQNAGCCIDVVQAFIDKLPMLGVCLGHQAVIEAFGGQVHRAPEPLHGHTSLVEHNSEGLFCGVPNPLTVCRYHSLAAAIDSLPSELSVTARTADGVVMAIQHRTRPVYGVQFHPEAILTEGGQLLIDNFCRVVRSR